MKALSRRNQPQVENRWIRPKILSAVAVGTSSGGYDNFDKTVWKGHRGVRVGENVGIIGINSGVDKGKPLLTNSTNRGGINIYKGRVE